MTSVHHLKAAHMQPNAVTEVTQEDLQTVLNAYIDQCHNGRVRKACACWYSKIRELEDRKIKGYKADVAMYNWAREQVKI